MLKKFLILYRQFYGPSSVCVLQGLVILVLIRDVCNVDETIETSRIYSVRRAILKHCDTSPFFYAPSGNSIFNDFCSQSICALCLAN